MTTRPPLIPVEQVDRDAAAALVLVRQNAAEPFPEDETVSGVHAEFLLTGEHDDEDVVQAFASHRLQARREALAADAALVSDCLTRLEWLLGKHSGLNLADHPAAIGQLSEMKLRLEAASALRGDS